MDNLKLWNSVVSKYNKKIRIHGGTKDGEFYSYIKSKQIFVPTKCFKSPDNWDIFALLHEIGHVMTNTDKMKRCEQEFMATKWAIEEAKNIGFAYPDWYVYYYQRYILKWRESGIKRGAKSIPSVKELTLIA